MTAVPTASAMNSAMSTIARRVSTYCVPGGDGSGIPYHRARGHLDGFTIDGEPVLGAYARSALSDWRVAGV
jgi:hypothetical protein